VEKALAKGKLPLLLILDGIEDPQNLGAIIRTAESAGVDGIIIPEHRAAHLSSAVARASAGALEHMPVAKVFNIAGFIGALKDKGFWVLGLAGEAEQDYTAFDMNLPLAVVLGSEGSGIRPLVRKSCDALVSLPMLGKVSSLNVSVASGIMLYEIIRQRKIR
jgi:23S rRNA (guanosine2251-2'-O)-methyltransferase